MNLNNIWKALGMVGVGAAASEDAEAAFFGPTGISRVFKPDYVDKVQQLAKLAKAQKPRTAGSPRLPNMGESSVNQTIWDSTGGKYFVDNAGNLRRVVLDTFDTDALLAKLRQAPDGFPVREVVSPDSKFAKAYPEQYTNSNIYVSPLGKGVQGQAQYTQLTGGNDITLNPTLVQRALLDEYGAIPRLMNTMEHELQHGIDAYEGLQGGASKEWFEKIFPAGVGAHKTPFDLYESTLGEQMARAAGRQRAWGEDPYEAMRAMTREQGSWIPEEAKALNPEVAENAVGYGGRERPWMWSNYGQAYPHAQTRPAGGYGRDPRVDDPTWWNQERPSKLQEYGPAAVGLALGMIPNPLAQLLSAGMDPIDYMMNPPTQEERANRTLPNMSITSQAALEDPYMMSLFRGY